MYRTYQAWQVQQLPNSLIHDTWTKESIFTNSTAKLFKLWVVSLSN